MNRFIPVFVALVFGVVIIATLTTLGIRGYYHYQAITNNVDIYEVAVPNYDGSATTYLTKQYNEKDGCITFLDEFRLTRRVCDKYTVTKWSN